MHPKYSFFVVNPQGTKVVLEKTGEGYSLPESCWCNFPQKVVCGNEWSGPWDYSVHSTLLKNLKRGQKIKVNLSFVKEEFLKDKENYTFIEIGDDKLLNTLLKKVNEIWRT